MTASTARANAARSRITGVCIGTPHNGFMTVPYVNSLLATVFELGQHGIGVSLLGRDNIGLIHLARNSIAAEFLGVDDASRLVFIDSDIEWRAPDLLRLISYDVDVVAGMYTMRRAPSTAWVGVPLRDQNGLVVDDPVTGLVAAEVVGAGFLSVCRRVFGRLIEAYPESRILGDQFGFQGHCHYNFFPSEVVDGVLEVEDFAFCRRWRAIGGKIWIDPTIALKHHGSFAFEADPMALLEAVQSAAHGA